MATMETSPRMSEFTNEPFVDFSKPENKQAMEAALKKVRSGIWARISDVHRRGKGHYYGEDDLDESVAPEAGDWRFQTATAEHAKQAVEASAKAFESWKRVPAEKRVEILFRAAEIFRRRKFEISALICAKWASRGLKRTRTPPKRSIFWNFTDARC